MTYSQIYACAKNILRNANIDDYITSASLIFEYCFKICRRDFPIYAQREAPKSLCEEFFRLINRRKGHYPLQYILGKWNFMGYTYELGEGVLIPRYDTEVLVNRCIKFLKELKNVEKINILDLCSGTGIIAITLAKEFENINVFAVEYYDQAFKYLEKNIKRHKILNVKAIKHNVLLEELPAKIKKNSFSLIVSNPPYIESGKINSLEQEVKKEPVSALDGGLDGLLFYKSILKNWKKLLCKGSGLCTEIGENQSKSVTKLFKINGFKNIEIINDLTKKPRVVFGII